MKNTIALIIILLALVCSSCDKEFRCDCNQDVGGLDTSYTLVGEGRSAKKVCDAFDSESIEFGITTTIDCEPF
ncbi:MAG: hypothetical protein ACHQFW_01505 [Chitinophagales bacterium]